jgi:hypothetical protein
MPQIAASQTGVLRKNARAVLFCHSYLFILCHKRVDVVAPLHDGVSQPVFAFHNHTITAPGGQQRIWLSTQNCGLYPRKSWGKGGRPAWTDARFATCSANIAPTHPPTWMPAPILTEPSHMTQHTYCTYSSLHSLAEFACARLEHSVLCESIEPSLVQCKCPRLQLGSIPACSTRSRAAYKRLDSNGCHLAS